MLLAALDTILSVYYGKVEERRVRKLKMSGSRSA
jgi:hypothetical protein